MSAWKSLKGKARKASPWLYDGLLKIGTSKISRTLRSAPSLVRDEWLLRRNAPILRVDLAERNGLGAMFSDAAQVLHYADIKGLTPSIRFLNPLYAPDPSNPSDWLDILLTRLQPASSDAPPIPLKQNLRRHLDRHIDALTIERANRLFLSHFAPNAELTAHVDIICAAKSIGRHTIGVHFRGTDKALEAPRVKWDLVKRALDARLSDFSNVLLASDEPEFLEHMYAVYGRDKLVDLDCAHIFRGSTPAHLSDVDGPEKAREAFVTMLALARCGLLIRGASHLSAWSKILNPSLEVIMLERPFSDFPFPDGLIWQDQKIH